MNWKKKNKTQLNDNVESYSVFFFFATFFTNVPICTGEPTSRRRVKWQREQLKRISTSRVTVAGPRREDAALLWWRLWSHCSPDELLRVVRRQTRRNIMAALPEVTQTLGLNLSQYGRLVTSVGRGLITQPTDGSRIIKGPRWKPDPWKIPLGKNPSDWDTSKTFYLNCRFAKVAGYFYQVVFFQSFVTWTVLWICVSNINLFRARSQSFDANEKTAPWCQMM